MSITVHLKKGIFFLQELAKILDFRDMVRSDNDIYIYIYPAGGYGSPRAHASPVLPNSGEMSKPVEVSRLEINNVPSVPLSLDCRMDWYKI